MAESADQAVRDYLTALSDPDKLRAQDRINELSQRLEANDDPLERLQLRAELAQAQAPDTDALEQDFVAHAKAWADEQGVTAKAFEQEGVSRDVLRRAGLDGGRGRGRRRQTTRTSRPRVSREDVVKAIPSRKQQFTIADVAAASGASTATVRKVVTDLMAEGKVEEAGTAEGHKGPGRARRCTGGQEVTEKQSRSGQRVRISRRQGLGWPAGRPPGSARGGRARSALRRRPRTTGLRACTAASAGRS